MTTLVENLTEENMEHVLEIADFRSDAFGYPHLLSCTMDEKAAESICTCYVKEGVITDCRPCHKHHWKYDAPNGRFAVGDCRCGLKKLSANTQPAAVLIGALSQRIRDLLAA